MAQPAGQPAQAAGAAQAAYTTPPAAASPTAPPPLPARATAAARVQLKNGVMVLMAQRPLSNEKLILPPVPGARAKSPVLLREEQ